MIVTSRFVFLHLHKSGGTFVNQFLRRFFPEAQLIGYHLPRAYLPAQFTHLPLFGLVRNPWDYYVSWYSFQMMRPDPNPLYYCASDDGQLGFTETIRNLVTLGEQPERLAKLQARLPDRFTGRGVNLTASCLGPLAGSPSGFYAFMYRRMYGDDLEVRIGRMESVRDELSAFLASLGIELTGDMAQYIRFQERTNTSVHGSYQEHYDDALRDLVATRDASIIGRFDYRFEPD